jgi:hypothetical protein
MGHIKIKLDGTDKLSTLMPCPGLENRETPGHPAKEKVFSLDIPFYRTRPMAYGM